MDDEVFEVVVKKKNGKRRLFQIVMRNRKIFIMLKKIDKTDITLIDISLATKVFLPFSSKENENSFILFSRDKCDQFFLADRHQLQKCSQYVDKKLETYHETWTTSIVHPLPLPPKSIENQIPDPEENPYISMQLRENTIIKGNQDDKCEYISFPRMKALETDHQDLYELDYPIPVYSEKYQPIVLEPEFSKNNRQIHSDEDSILYVSKLRSEIKNKGGMIVEMDISAVQNIQVIEYGNSVWISKLFRWDSLLPRLYVGDRIVQVNYFEVNTKFEYIQQTKANVSYLIIQRLPMGKVFLKSNQVIVTKKDKHLWMIKSKNKELKNKLDNYYITEINGVNALSMENRGQINQLIKSDKAYPIIAHPKSFLQYLKTD